MTTTCAHERYEIEVLAPEAYEDTNVRRFSLRARCRECKESVRFLGIDEGLNLSRPCTSSDGLTVIFPAVMEFEEPEYEQCLAS
jgi:hypothetical protein